MRQGRESEATEAVFCLKGKKASSYRGAYRVPLSNWSACLSVSLSERPFVCLWMCNNILRCFYWLRELYEADPTNPGYLKAGDCGQKRGTCFAACRLELVAVAGRLWISWRVIGEAGSPRFFFPFSFSSNAHGLLQVWGRLASFTSVLVVLEHGEDWISVLFTLLLDDLVSRTITQPLVSPRFNIFA